MIKNNKKMIIISLAVTLLPVLVGLILWNRLPAEIATHFDGNGNPNGWSSKAFTVFGIPTILTAVQALLVFMLNADPKKENITLMPLKLAIWIVPACSLFCLGICYANALGVKINIGLIVSIFIGLIFILMGIYLPRNKRNYSVGFRTPWTLNDDKNWEFSNRIGGYCFVGAGIIIIVAGICGSFGLMVAAVLLAALIPFIASYVYYRKHQ